MIYTSGQAKILRKKVEERKKTAGRSDGETISGRNTDSLIKAVLEIVGRTSCLRAEDDG